MTPLRLQMIEDMKSAGLPAGMQAVYVDAVRRLAARYRRSPAQLSEEEERGYLLGLRARCVALGTFKAYHGGTIGARLIATGPSFKKRIRPPKQLRPEVLSDQQVRSALGCVRNPVHKGCFALMYACGLRMSEAATLEIGAIDSANLRLRIIARATESGSCRCHNRTRPTSRCCAAPWDAARAAGITLARQVD